MENFVVYLEVGQKRTFAGALDWPGWCRSGADEDSALRALLDYGPRYAKVTTLTGLDYEPPAALAAFTIVERLAGSSTTDFVTSDQTLVITVFNRTDRNRPRSRSRRDSRSP